MCSDQRTTISDLQAATGRSERWCMLTSYDVLTAGLFERAGVRALLVGDTSAELVLGYPSTLPATMAELITMTRAVVAGTRTALIGDAQILTWPDMAGLTSGRLPRFVRRYADADEVLLAAARQYVSDVASGQYPDAEHSYA